MYIADHLSRAYLPNQEEQDEEFQVFVLEVEALNPFDSLTVSSERLAQLQKATEQDPVPQTLKTTVGRMARTEKRDTYSNQRILDLQRRHFLTQWHTVQEPTHHHP